MARVHVLIALAVGAAAFSPPDAAKTLFAAQDAALAKIKDALPLEPKDYPSSLGLDAFSTPDGGKGTLESFEAPGPANIAWCSDLKIEGETSVASLTVWCAPLKDIPHLVCRTTVTPDAVDAYVDFRPRAAVGYETRLEDGSYPEPDSREAFMSKGARKDFDDRFYDGVAELCGGVGGEAAPARGLAELEALAASPVLVDARLPAEDASVAKAAELCTAAADAWLAWTQEDGQHDLKPGMQVTSTYARDTKIRANNYGVLADYYTSLFGDFGSEVAAGDAGPLDEAYVGGAS